MVPFGLTEGENIYSYFIQDGSVAHTENFSVASLRRGFQYIAHSLWTHRSPDLNMCDYYFGGH
jgi:hypothetical protein